MQVLTEIDTEKQHYAEFQGNLFTLRHKRNGHEVRPYDKIVPRGGFFCKKWYYLLHMSKKSSIFVADFVMLSLQSDAQYGLWQT